MYQVEHVTAESDIDELVPLLGIPRNDRSGGQRRWRDPFPPLYTID